MSGNHPNTQRFPVDLFKSNRPIEAKRQRTKQDELSQIGSVLSFRSGVFLFEPDGFLGVRGLRLEGEGKEFLHIPKVKDASTAERLRLKFVDLPSTRRGRRDQRA